MSVKRTVVVEVDALTSLLESAIARALKNAAVYHKAGMIAPDATARVLAGLGASGCILVDEAG